MLLEADGRPRSLILYAAREESLLAAAAYLLRFTQEVPFPPMAASVR